MDADERVRRQAVRRVLAGERVVEVARALGRSERWLFKWLSRYDPTDAGWALERSRAPEHVPNQSDPKIEALVLQVRARLAAQPWSQIGAPAIAWELEKLHLRTIPELRTIERILERAGVPRREVRSRYVAKGTPYPAAAQRPAPNALQEADLVGPRHLSGGIPFYACNVVDVGRRAAACELQPNKSDAATAASLVRIWGRLGIPVRLKLDNWLVATLNHALPRTAWLCLELGVIPVFVPVREWSCPAFVDTLMLGAQEAQKECPRAQDPTAIPQGVPRQRGQAAALVRQDDPRTGSRPRLFDRVAAQLDQAG